MSSRGFGFLFLVAVLSGLPSCGRRPRPQPRLMVILVPPSPPPDPKQAVSLPDPPLLASKDLVVPELPVPVPTADVRPYRERTTRGTRHRPPKAVEEPETDDTAPAEPALKLERLLTSEEAKSYEQAIARSLTVAERNLKIAAQKNLTQAQEDEVKRIRTFIDQARQARETDLLIAKSLSDRAEALARNLVRSQR